MNCSINVSGSNSCWEGGGAPGYPGESGGARTEHAHNMFAPPHAARAYFPSFLPPAPPSSGKGVTRAQPYLFGEARMRRSKSAAAEGAAEPDSLASSAALYHKGEGKWGGGQKVD